MDSLYLLVPLSVLVAVGGGLLFWWATRSGQFDDLEGPAHRILQDDDSASGKGRSDESTRQE
ncbi:cbb3-type cytochrome oxidase assembly protein CcoS [Chitinimonas arctica]|uniref:Cbb3-type cytochrome oxidase assembly protein CcoS n=1 Tax=Chitinimonas arctica TaxID=2594795 RepID=A0A516SK76_9NEIS|nr:cbb3-type cytochrome oxidase assembly protein CcoS [Chitinimonas arctica]QDQ28559.1 cbb3-type cytochrome oxidase assembly protein CcoS [Chitinimonas arctica]